LLRSWLSSITNSTSGVSFSFCIKSSKI
jgi:hypothetical protein